MTRFNGFGRGEDANFFWCRLGGARIFKNVCLAKQLIWNKIRWLASIWFKAHGLSKGISVTLAFLLFVCYKEEKRRKYHRSVTSEPLCYMYVI